MSLKLPTLALMTAAVISAAAIAESTRVPVYVLGFRMVGETGVVQPIDIQRAEWPVLESQTEQQLQAAVNESDQQRKLITTGTIAVRAYDKRRQVVHRATVRTGIWRHFVGDAAHPAPPPERLKSSDFTLVIPISARTLTIEGWMPGTRSTFDVERIRRELSCGELKEKK